MKTAIGMAALAAMLLLAHRDSARAESSASDTNRNTAVKSPGADVKEEMDLRTYRIFPRAAAIFYDDSLGTNTPPAVQRENVKKFLVGNGVLLPEGAYLEYKPSLNILIISGSVANLARVERLVSDLNKAPPMVKIGVRFIEIIGENIAEGQSWPWEINSRSNETTDVSADRRKTEKMMSDASAKLEAAVNKAKLMEISSIVNDSELTFVLHLLEQHAGANLLSAPEVTTESGMPAEIRVGREIIYPYSFSVQSAGADQKSDSSGSQASKALASISNQVAGSVVIPAEFQTRDTGIKLNVTPIVDPDGKTIFLTLNPEVVELVEWIDYGYQARLPDGTIQQNKMPMPVFHARALNTQIALQDGQTVAMGGLISETTEEGERPSWFGRLFGAKPEIRTVNKHLIILVTARIVDAAGNPIGMSKGE